VKTMFFVTVAAIVCLPLLACHGSDLTRGKARRMLEQFGATQSFNLIGLNPDEMHGLATGKNAKAIIDKFFRSDFQSCAFDPSNSLPHMSSPVTCWPVSTHDLTEPGSYFT
jgi:hypothetical protein